MSLRLVELVTDADKCMCGGTVDYKALLSTALPPVLELPGADPPRVKTVNETFAYLRQILPLYFSDRGVCGGACKDT